MNKKILVVADMVENTPVAIRQACELARVYQARLHIVHFCYVDTDDDPQEAELIRTRVTQSVMNQAEKVVRENIPDGIEYDHDVEWCQHIYQWVNDYADAVKPCLVIKTGHRTESAFYTPTDWRILRECPATVLLAPETKWRKGTNVMAAVDLETSNAHKLALNEKILESAHMMATHYGVEMHVVYSPSAPQILNDLGIRDPADVEAKAKEKLQTRIDEIAQKYALPQANVHIRAGQAELIIPSLAAKHKAALVVIGMVGRTGLKGKILGNTAEKILTLLKTDVLALKPDE